MVTRIRILFTVMALVIGITVNAQVTTSAMSGKVTDSNNEAVIGATVKAVHEPSGTSYGAVTNVDGRYTIQGMRVGGPYKVTVTYIGYETKTYDNVTLRLGETFSLNVNMSENAQELGEVVVTSRRGLDATKTGAAQSISARQIDDMPSLSHSIADIARLNPQISTNGQSGAMSFAGVNNRYNSFQVDGAMNNDVFGLTASGQNGGQASANPVSMETIDQIQVNVAPFDVRQGGFTGGAINAITKSGTNEFHGSGYYYGNNQELVGRHYKLGNGKYSDPYTKEKESLFGFTLGGPIIKDKLFFFANYERQTKSYPTQYGIGAEGSRVDASKATDVLNAIKDLAQMQGYNYNPVWADGDIYTNSDKLGLKIDWNINDFNKFTLRWSYVTGTDLNGAGGMSTLNTTDHLYEFKSQTHSFIAELQSRLSPVLSNEARASYVRVRDKRTSGAAAPSITVKNVGDGTVNIGNEYSSMANSLNQDIFTVEDNLTWQHGNHTYTFGTHNEFYKFSNLFIQNLYGSYYFNSYDDFMNYYNGYKAGNPDGSLIVNYYYGQANTEVTGDPRWAASFGAGQLGFYAQDKWDITDNLQITYGIRMDLPVFFDKPAENADFNKYSAIQGWDFKTNSRLSSTPMWSPRVGFRWDINNDRKYILRGGVGIFTGRIPFVWLSNNFSNTGIQTSSYSVSNNKDVTLYLDPNKQSQNVEKLTASGSQLINVFDKDFKFAQNLRVNIGFDFNALGIDWTAEAIYSKTLNDVYYKNLAYGLTGETFADKTGYEWDTRPMLERKTSGTPFNNIYALYNTNEGYTYNLSLKAEKHFNFGLDLMASYTFTKSKSVSSVTSSVAQSNWRNNFTHGNPNKPELSNSAFNVPHTVKFSAFYHADYGRNKMFSTIVGLIWQGQSGTPYSLYYNGDLNGDGYSGNDLLYIPTDAQIDRMAFKATSAYTEEQQRANLKQWLASTPYLKDHRGEYFERYADNMKFEGHFDFHFAQQFRLKTGSYTHTLEVSMDIMNLANLLNKKWGRTYASSYMSTYASPINYDSKSGAYQFLHDGDYKVFTPTDYYSRWRGQIGVKYTF